MGDGGRLFFLGIDGRIISTGGCRRLSETVLFECERLEKTYDSLKRRFCKRSEPHSNRGRHQMQLLTDCS